MKELQIITDLVNNNSNDTELGSKIRTFINKIETNENNFIKCFHCGKYQSKFNHFCKYCKEEM